METVMRSIIKYMDELENNFSSMHGCVMPNSIETEKECLKSYANPKHGYISWIREKELGYLTEIIVDIKHGIIIKVDCYPIGGRTIYKRPDMRLQGMQNCTYFPFCVIDLGAARINTITYYSSFCWKNQKLKSN